MSRDAKTDPRVGDLATLANGTKVRIDEMQAPSVGLYARNPIRIRYVSRHVRWIRQAEWETYFDHECGEEPEEAAEARKARERYAANRLRWPSQRKLA